MLCFRRKFLQNPVVIGWATVVLVVSLVFIIGACILSGFATRVKEYSQGNDDAGGNEVDELIFVQIVYRHGNRTPIISYPNDPYLTSEYFPEGLGNLTDIGKESQFQLGRYFQERYKSLLGDNFSLGRVYVRSTAKDRALESAKFISAGLLSPPGNQTWKEFEDKHIVPIHTVPLDEDYLLHIITCPKGDKQWRNAMLDEEKRLQPIHSELFKYLEENIGSPVNTLVDLYYLYDSLSIEHQRGLTLPFWAQNVLKTSKEAFEYFAAVALGTFTSTTETKKIRSGFLLKEILDRFQNKTMRLLDSERLMHLYSGHDHNIVNLLNGFNVFDFADVSFGASLLFELYRSGGEYHVQILYRNSNAEPFPVISIPNCGTKCPLNKMYQLFEDILPTENETAESLCRL